MVVSLKKVLVLAVVSVLCSSCGVIKRGTIPWDETEAISGAKAMVPAAMSREERVIRTKLDEAYNDWKGTRYILGGTSSNGIDCSAFMQVVFREYLNINLPRTTQEQMRVGNPVQKKDIKIGDMVFFRTGRNTYHVGVMINSQQFLHASTSSGVTISNLQNQYWQNIYLTTRRVL